MSEYIKREAVCNDCGNRAICIDKSCCPVGRAIAVDVVAREDLARVQVAYDKVGQALDAADKFYMQGYNYAMADHNLMGRDAFKKLMKRYEKATGRAPNGAVRKTAGHKRGYWMDAREFCGDFMCSNCDALYGTNKFNFCPHCGADMRPQDDPELFYVPPEEEDA